MLNTCQYRIGGLTLVFIPDELEGEYFYFRPFPDFHFMGTAEIELRVHGQPAPGLPDRKVVFDNERGWRLEQAHDRFVLSASSFAQDPALVGIFAQDFRSGDIYTTRSLSYPDQFLFPFSTPFAEIYMVNLLSQGYGMLLHACGVIWEGQGIIFAGFGGAGKTTTARLWSSLPGAQVLSDDKVIVRQVDGQYRLYGTPWPGEGGMALALEAPIKKVYILKQAKTNYARQLDSFQAVTELIGRSFAPYWSDQGMDFSLEFLEGLYKDVGCAELGFLPEMSAVDFVRQQL